MASTTYYDFSSVTTLADGDIIPVAPATPGKYLKIAWSALKQLIVNLVRPVGSWYTQYPSDASNDPAVAFPSSESPAALFGGTWELMYSTEGIVFQTEGYDGAGRLNGLMEDQFQAWQLGGVASDGASYYLALDELDYGFTGFSEATLAKGNFRTTTKGLASRARAMDDGTNGTPRSGTRTAHRNRLRRLYRRIA